MKIINRPLEVYEVGDVLVDDCEHELFIVTKIYNEDLDNFEAEGITISVHMIVQDEFNYQKYKLGQYRFLPKEEHSKYPVIQAALDFFATYSGDEDDFVYDICKQQDDVWL